MQVRRHLTGVIHKDDDVYVAPCPELDIASQGTTLEEARANLVEAVELFFESASNAEIGSHLNGNVYVTPIEVKVG